MDGIPAPATSRPAAAAARGEDAGQRELVGRHVRGGHAGEKVQSLAVVAVGGVAEEHGRPRHDVPVGHLVEHAAGVVDRAGRAQGGRELMNVARVLLRHG